jgi:spermidine synthase
VERQAVESGAGHGPPRAALLYVANIIGCASGAALTGFVLADYFSTKAIAMLLLACGTACALVLIGSMRTQCMPRSGV